MLLREYVDSLDGVAKSRYFDRLKDLGLAATDDRYASGDFQNAMRLWPPVKSVTFSVASSSALEFTHDRSCSN